MAIHDFRTCVLRLTQLADEIQPHPLPIREAI